VPKKMNRLGALGPAIKGFFFPIERPAEAPVSPGMPPVSPRPEREEISSGQQ
jgi:ubiquinol-cytochrome c reductase cytochrome b subunit